MGNSLLQRFLRGMISIGLSSSLGMLFGFASVVLAARLLTTEEFGIFVLLQVITVFLAEITGFGLPLATSHAISSTDDPDRMQRIVNTSFYVRLATIVLAGALIFGIGAWVISLSGEPRLSEVLFAIPLLFGLESLGKLLRSILQGYFRFKIIGVIEILNSASNLFLLLLFVLYLDLGLNGMIIAKLLAMLIAYGTAYVCTPIQHRLVFDLPLLRGMLRFGLPLQLNYLMSFSFMRIDTLTIAVLLGPSGIAYYEVARKLPDSLLRLYEAFRAVFFPFMARLFADREYTMAARMLNDSTRWLSFLTCYAALFVLLFGKQIITLLFGVEYLASYPAFVLLMIGLNLTIVETTLGYALVAIGQTDKPLIVNLVRSLISLGGNFLLIPILGFMGAALANIAGNFFTAPIDILFLRRQQIDARMIVYLKPLAILGIFAVLAIGLPGTLATNLVLMAIFPLVSFLFAVVTSQDLGALARVTRLRQWPLRAATSDEGAD